MQVCSRTYNLILERASVHTRPSPPRPRRVSPLDHKLVDDTVEDCPAVIPAFGELGKVVTSLGSVEGVKLDDDGTEGGLEDDCLCG